MPVFAPIGAAILGAGASATAAAVVGTAVVGAVAGGVYSAATGGNIVKGVVIGGVVGAGAGYIGAAMAAGSGAAGGAGAGSSLGTAAANTAAGSAARFAAIDAMEAAGASAGAGAAAEGAMSVGEAMMMKSGVDFLSGAAKEYARGESEMEQAKAAKEAKMHSYIKTDLAKPRFDSGQVASFEEQMAMATDANASMSNYRNYFKPTTFDSINTAARKAKPMVAPPTNQPAPWMPVQPPVPA